MNAWSAREWIWARALLGAMIPAPVDASRPGLADLDLTLFAAQFQRRASLALRCGLRLAVWTLTWLALLCPGGGKPFHRLDTARQDRFLEQAAASRLYLVRQLVVTLRSVAMFAYFRDPAVRASIDAAYRP